MLSYFQRFCASIKPCSTLLELLKARAKQNSRQYRLQPTSLRDSYQSPAQHLHIPDIKVAKITTDLVARMVEAATPQRFACCFPRPRASPQASPPDVPPSRSPTRGSNEVGAAFSRPARLASTCHCGSRFTGDSLYCKCGGVRWFRCSCGHDFPGDQGSCEECGISSSLSTPGKGTSL